MVGGFLVDRLLCGRVGAGRWDGLGVKETGDRVEDYVVITIDSLRYNIVSVFTSDNRADTPYESYMFG